MKFKSVLLLVLLLSAAAIVPFAFSQKSKSGDTTAEITSLEQQGVKADLANDPSFVQKYYADDFTGGSSWGVWDTKQSILKDMSDPKNNNTSKEEISDIKVRTYGNTAIATYKETYDSLYHGEHRARTILGTDTWVKQDGGWKLVAGHASEEKQ